MAAMTDGEKNDILVFVKRHPRMTLMDIAREFGRDVTTITRLLRSLKPTTELARATLLSRASELVDRVTEKADIDQVIDILSRPNIGVLDPIVGKSGGGGGGVNVLVSVQAGSLAALTETPEVPALDGETVEEAPGRVKRISIDNTPVGEFYKSSKD